jgi:signal peptidase I
MDNAIRNRRPWLAALMSVVLPGFGQLYNGQVNKAVWMFFAFTFFVIPFWALTATYLPDGWLIPTLILATVICIGIWLYGVADAWLVANKEDNYVLRPWQVSGTYLSAMVVCGVFALPLVYTNVRGRLVEPFKIPSTSMHPSVLRGDFITADKRYNCPGCKHSAQRGDIAIFVYPNDRSFNYIKRIIGLPGDQVKLNGREIFINGKSLKASETKADSAVQVIEAWNDRQWKVAWSLTETPLPNVELTVPPGHVFVLGDSRNASKDSRDFGTVPLQDVVGRARQVWWSSGDDGIRWQRLGKVLE